MDPENQSSQAFTFDDSAAAPGSEILDSMPDVQEHAIAAHEAKLEEAAANAETDDEGTPFDSAIHTGTKLKSGIWRKKKSTGSSPGSFVAQSRKRQQAGATTAEVAPPVDQNAEAVATGTVIASLFLGMCQSIGGDEWEPTKQERDFQTSAWQAYCVAKQYNQLSPGLALAVALGSYAAPRFAKPKTSAKVSRVYQWTAIRIAKWKIKRELRKRGIQADVIVEGSIIYVNGTPSDEAPELK